MDPLLAALPAEARERLVRLRLVPAERELEEVAEALGVLRVLLPEEDRRVLRVVELPAEDLVERAVETHVHPECGHWAGHEVRLHAASVRGLDVFDAVVEVRGGGGQGGDGDETGREEAGCDFAFGGVHGNPLTGDGFPVARFGLGTAPAPDGFKYSRKRPPRGRVESGEKG